MLARLQQAITLGLLLVALVWAAYFVRAGAPGWALAGVLLIVFGYALFLAFEFVLLAFVQERAPTPPPTARQLLQAWAAEVVTAPRVFCWRQPFRSRAEPDHLPQACAGRRGVLFVHGFVCNRGLWNPWMARLRAEGVPFIAVNLEPVFGSIGEYAPIIDAAMARLAAATGCAPLIVAHSMGGLAVREWLRGFDDDAYARLHRIVTIATPHQGTWLARWGRTVNGIEMRLKSPLVTRLGAAGSVRRHGLFTCFYGNCDNIVFPASTAMLPGADNRHLPGVAHVQMAFHPAVFDEVRRLLAEPPRETPAPRALRPTGELS